MRSFTSVLVAALLAALTDAVPYKPSVMARQDASSHLVFCHFMMGIVPNRGSRFAYISILRNDINQVRCCGLR
jgi:hypothetical protein